MTSLPLVTQESFLLLDEHKANVKSVTEEIIKAAVYNGQIGHGTLDRGCSRRIYFMGQQCTPMFKCLLPRSLNVARKV